MSNFNTLDAITDNLESVLKKQGINFSVAVFDDIAAIPASILPVGQIFYEGEEPEYNHGEKPKTSEARFMIRVVMPGHDERGQVRAQQEWTRKIREAVTVAALNIGSLASSKLVSWVATDDISFDNTPPRTAVSYRLRVRYREQ